MSSYIFPGSHEHVNAYLRNSFKMCVSSCATLYFPFRSFNLGLFPAVSQLVITLLSYWHTEQAVSTTKIPSAERGDTGWGKSWGQSRGGWPYGLNMGPSRGHRPTYPPKKVQIHHFCAGWTVRGEGSFGVGWAQHFALQCLSMAQQWDDQMYPWGKG